MRRSVTRYSLLLVLLPALAFAQRSDDDEAELLVREARAAVAAQKYDRAAQALDRALAIDPRRIDAYVLRASVHAVKKEHARAVVLLRRARELAPENLDVQTALGSHLVLGGQAAEGVPLLEAVLARDGTRYQAHAVLAGHHAATGEPALAAASYRAYLASRPAALAREDGRHMNALGRVQLAAGDAAGARATFAAVLGKNGKDLEAQFGEAWAAAAIDCRQAQPLLERLQPHAEKYPDLLLVRGKCALATGRAARAIALAEQYLAVKGAPAPGMARALKAEALAESGDLAGARREFGAALAADANNLRLLIRLARVERLAGDPASAVKRLRAARPGDDPAAFDFHIELGEGLLALGEIEPARETVRPLVAARPEHAGARILAGAIHVAAGEWAAAVPELERGLSADPGSTRARQLLASALGALGARSLREKKLPEAMETLARADGLGGGPVIWRNLGIAYLAAEKPAQALPHLERAARGGKDGLALLLSARALAMLGRYDEARQKGEAALAASGGDAAREVDVVLDIAATELEAGDPERATVRLERALGSAPAGERARLLPAFRVASRAAAARAMSQGGYSSALRHLERLVKLAPPTDGDERIAVRCELALAATGAGDRQAAEQALRQLSGRVRCPFPAPADELAVPVLSAIAAATGDPARAERSLAKLAALSRRAGGDAADRMIADATRFVAIRAAADAYARGRGDKARRFLELARKQRGGHGNAELNHDLAVLDLDAGRVDQAIAQLERLTGDVPEAWVNLALAYERKGQRARALETLERAERAGVRFAPLKDWIAAKQRILGRGGEP